MLLTKTFLLRTRNSNNLGWNLDTEFGLEFGLIDLFNSVIQFSELFPIWVKSENFTRKIGTSFTCSCPASYSGDVHFHPQKKCQPPTIRCADFSSTKDPQNTVGPAPTALGRLLGGGGAA